jgi:hypothetical protein
MQIVFDAGKLTGDAMNQCFLLKEKEIEKKEIYRKED